jgi:hypothetical protein
VKLCPVDLAGCDRPGCSGGHCELADTRALLVCWQCGVVESHGIVHGICVACVQAHMTTHDKEEA